MRELARAAPAGESFRVYLVGGSTAVLAGWRAATVDADLSADDEAVFRDVQGIKERLRLNIEFARPEHFVPPLTGSAERHVFIERVRDVEFYHYDPYAQLLSKVVRGFRKDLLDAENFVASGMVDPARFRELVEGIPDAAYARHPNLSRAAVEDAVDAFLSTLE
jgi:hypothetical protein